MMTSRPFKVVARGVRIGEAVAVAEGGGSGDGEGDGEGVGEGVAVASRLKLAHLGGCTLTQSLWTPGASPSNGLTRVVKLPFASEFAEPATWSAWSQKSFIDCLARTWPPMTL